jgi:hypothetical protein
MTGAGWVMATHDRALAIGAQAHGFPVVGIFKVGTGRARCFDGPL